METLKINRELMTIWVLAVITIATVIATKNRIFMLPLFAYVIYQSVRGIIANRAIYYTVAFSFLLMISAFAIYAIV